MKSEYCEDVEQK